MKLKNKPTKILLVAQTGQVTESNQVILLMLGGMGSQMNQIKYIQSLEWLAFKSGYDKHFHRKGCAWCKHMWWWQSHLDRILEHKPNKNGHSNYPPGVGGLQLWRGVW